jgi:hypothetical protein
MLKVTFGAVSVSLGLLASSALLTGCADKETPTAEAHAGTLTAALTTTGSDGATYAFPSGAFLSVSSMTTGDFIPLDGVDTVLNRKLPVGTYTATLYYAGGDVVLDRTLSGVTSSVPAVWTDSQPVSFDIVDQQTTPLVLHFKVEGLGDVTFQVGTLQLSFDVTKESAQQPTRADAQGSASFFMEEDADPTAAYATSLHIDQGVPYAYHLQLQGGGDWVNYAGGTACKYGTLGISDASDNPALALRAAEEVGASGGLCVYDQGASDYIVLYASRTGAPPMGQESFLPDASYSFYVQFGSSTPDLFDGTTLKQSLLEAPLSLSNGNFYQYIYDSSFNLVTLVGATTSPATIQLLP